MIFSSSFLREMNYKTALIIKTENLRKTNNLRYSQLIDKYKAEHKKLNMLPVEKLKDLVSEF